MPALPPIRLGASALTLRSSIHQELCFVHCGKYLHSFTCGRPALHPLQLNPVCSHTNVFAHVASHTSTIPPSLGILLPKEYVLISRVVSSSISPKRERVCYTRLRVFAPKTYDLHRAEALGDPTSPDCMTV